MGEGLPRPSATVCPLFVFVLPFVCVCEMYNTHAIVDEQGVLMSHYLRCALTSCVDITAHSLFASVCSLFVWACALFVRVCAAPSSWPRHTGPGRAACFPQRLPRKWTRFDHTPRTHLRTHTYIKKHTPPTCTLPARHAHTHPAGIHTHVCIALLYSLPSFGHLLLRTSAPSQ